MSFQSPLVLLCLIAVPAALALYVADQRRRPSVAARFASPPLLGNLVGTGPRWRRHLPFALVIGAARPRATVTVRREQATVILALDVSRSMAAKDVEPTRLDAARLNARTLLERIPKKFRVAVVSFASRAIVALPPTADRPLAEQALAELQPGQGTALGDAVAAGVRLARCQRTSDGKIPPAAMLLISDGKPDGGRISPATAAQQAKAQAIPIYSVLVGTPGGVVEETLPGGLHAIIQVPPSPETLRQLARTTGGEFFTAGSDQRLRDVYERLGSRLGEQKQRREVSDLFGAGAAVLLLAGGTLSTMWFQRVP